MACKYSQTDATRRGIPLSHFVYFNTDMTRMGCTPFPPCFVTMFHYGHNERYYIYLKVCNYICTLLILNNII